MKTAITSAKGVEKLQKNAIAETERIKEQTKSILMERATSMVSKIETFAKQTYGGFMSEESGVEPPEKIIQPFVYGDETHSGLLANVSETILKMDDPSDRDHYISVPEYDPSARNRIL